VSFAAVATDGEGRVREIQVKSPTATSSWIWGAFKMPGAILHALHRLWSARQPRDEYIGTLVNAYLAQGGVAVGVRAGRSYVDVGTLNGYREAMALLSAPPVEQGAGRDGPIPIPRRLERLRAAGQV
jgi:hypothetical protein